MESMNEFKIWLKNFHEQLSSKNKALTTFLLEKRQKNLELDKSNKSHSDNSLNTSTLSIDVISNNVGSELEDSVRNLKLKSEQLSKCSESISTKVEEETTKIRSTLYDVITKDETALKPYHDVEEAINELSRKTSICMGKLNEDIETFKKNLKEREKYFTEITQDVTTLEAVDEEMRGCIQNLKKNMEEDLISFKLNNVEEATDDSNESKALHHSICKIKSELNIQ